MNEKNYIVASAAWAMIVLTITIIPGSEISKAGVGEPGSNIAHFGEFMVFGYLLSRGFPRLKNAILIAAFYGIITEVLQLYVPGRFFSYADIAMNEAGTAFGVLATLQSRRASMPKVMLP